MQLGMVGQGRMGAHRARRFIAAGHECVVFDVNPQNVAELVSHVAVGGADYGAPILASALFGRFASCDNDKFANELLSAMRYYFGGHVEKPEVTL